ncbi:hypothetical protein B7494_g4943 [Chlorociboria aeruginascens]|nr:hypothetical protein B7494_g4943 [Chlorociboria aeruginascens]
MANLRTKTSVDEEHLRYLLARQAEIQAEIEAISSSAPPASSFHRSPIHKQLHQRRSHVPRSMSNSGTSMARNLSSEAPSQRRTLSQRSAPAMARTNSRGTSSLRITPFAPNGVVPPLLSPEHLENPIIEAWASQDQPLSFYTLSHQPPSLLRSMSQRKPDLERVPELVGESPAEFLMRTEISTPTLSITPSIPIPQSRQQISSHPRESSYHIPTPTTPTTDSLTNATTLTSSMSRQNSLCNEPILESIKMMKFNSNTSYSTDMNYVDDTMYQVTPYTPPSHHSRRSSNEEQSQLLVGAGGASHNSQFSPSFAPAEDVARFQSSACFGEKMEKSQSAESNLSTSSSSSRNKQRLQVSNMAAARPLMPKGGLDDNMMSRANSSQSMTRIESNNGSDKVAISKPSYQRPKHERVFCKQCDEHPDGFRGEHELRRHQDRQHKSMVKKWVCIEPSGQGHPKPVLPLSRCKACGQQRKKYGAYYNAAAHLRRTHFKPKAKGRSKNSKIDESQKRGGKAGGDWPSMQELKSWMKEVEEPATEYPLSASQQQEADDSDDEGFDNTLDDVPPDQAIGMATAFDPSFVPDSTMFDMYTTPNTQLFGQNMPLDLSSQPNIDSSMNYSCQNSFDNNFSPFPSNDALAFCDPSIQSSFDDQSHIPVLDYQNFPL